MSRTYFEYEALAIAFLTGQATAEQAEEYRRLYASDAGFKVIVDDIESWLAPLNDAISDQRPPDGLLDDIMQQIEQEDDSKPTTQPEKTPSPANDTFPKPANDYPSGRWRALAIASSFIAILAVGSHFIIPQPSTNMSSSDTQTLMALLSDSTQPELMAIVYEPNSGKVVARLSNITVPEDGDLELWLIRKGKPAPVSLGILNRVDEGDRIELLLPLALQTGTDTLAISLEEIGGSKSDGPEGPVLYTGAVSTL